MINIIPKAKCNVKIMWIKRFFIVNCNSNYIFNFLFFHKQKIIFLAFFFFSFIDFSLLFSFNFVQLRSRRKWEWIEREKTVERGWRWCFLCLILFFLSQINKKKRKRRWHQSNKKKDRVATERRKQQREWDFMVWLMVRKLCGLLLSVLKSLLWLIILPLTKWIYLLRKFLISPSNP
jgi:hypothetical protein